MILERTRTSEVKSPHAALVPAYWPTRRHSGLHGRLKLEGDPCFTVPERLVAPYRWQLRVTTTGLRSEALVYASGFTTPGWNSEMPL